MKLVHLSDTHLGYRGQGIEKMVDDPWRLGVPIRQREADLMLGLIRAVDRILEQPHPDVVLHSGNLFDTARPTAHLLDFAMTQLRRLTEAGIPVVIVEGNHSSPRDRSHGQALRLLAHLPRVQVICHGAQRVQVGTILLHAFPHRALLEGALPDCKSQHSADGGVQLFWWSSSFLCLLCFWSIALERLDELFSFPKQHLRVDQDKYTAPIGIILGFTHKTMVCSSVTGYMAACWLVFSQVFWKPVRGWAASGPVLRSPSGLETGCLAATPRFGKLGS